MPQPRERSDIMLCYQFEEKRLLKWPKPWIVQPKLEGDRCRAIGGPAGFNLLSSTGLPRVSVPHIVRYLNENWHGGPIEFDGELYIHGEPHETIRSIVSRTQDIHPKHKRMEYWIYDLINTDTQIDRLRTLHSLFTDSNKTIKTLEHRECTTLEEVYKLYEMVIKNGFEGIIIRHPNVPYFRKRTTTMMKLKPRMTGYFVCTQVFEELDIHTKAPKGRLGAIEVQNVDGKTFNVGSGFNAGQRELYWDDPSLILGMVIKVQYQSLTENGIPKMQSFKEVM